VRFSPTNPSRVYHMMPQLSFPDNFFRRSDDGGATWSTKVSSLIADKDKQNFYAPFV